MPRVMRPKVKDNPNTVGRVERVNEHYTSAPQFM
jgi:hypothetical protein